MSELCIFLAHIRQSTHFIENTFYTKVCVSYASFSRENTFYREQVYVSYASFSWRIYVYVYVYVYVYA